MGLLCKKISKRCNYIAKDSRAMRSHLADLSDAKHVKAWKNFQLLWIRNLKPENRKTKTENMKY